MLFTCQQIACAVLPFTDLKNIQRFRLLSVTEQQVDCQPYVNGCGAFQRRILLIILKIFSEITAETADGSWLNALLSDKRTPE